jgi:hypothetical protein
LEIQVLVLNGKRKRCCGNHDTDVVDLLRCLGGRHGDLLHAASGKERGAVDLPGVKQQGLKKREASHTLT